MLITCKCLNVTLRLGKSKPKGISIASLQLNLQEASHLFFAEGVAEVEDILEITNQIPSLIVSQVIGNWTIDSCINCAVPFFAQNKDKTQLPLISAGLISDPNTIQSLRNSQDFSPVFRIVTRLYNDDDISKLGNHSAQKVKEALSGLQKQLGDAIHKQGIKTEENIRNYSDQQYELLDNYRERALRDHNALVKLLRIAESHAEESSTTTVMTASIQKLNYPVSPTKAVPPAAFETIIRNSPKTKPLPTSPAMGITSHRSAGRSLSLFSPRGNMSESLDVEGVFNLEGMEDSPLEMGVSEGESDTDHDDSGSHDEGIDLRRKKGNNLHLARSLPVNVPVFAPGKVQVKPVEVDLDLEEAQDPRDIAASIKALARSVHGDAVFGDLPRPRFSTQI